MDLPVDYKQLSSKKKKEVREEYVKAQKELCWYCKKPLYGKPAKNVLSYVLPKNVNEIFHSGFFAHPVHLHHNHETGMTIGAVHCLCNAVLFLKHGE